MQRAIIGTLLASQDNMDRRPNTFELFGADFMICENYYPWLIEINSSPDLGNTTSVTARMCPQCLEDTVKGEADNFKLVPNSHCVCPLSSYHRPEERSKGGHGGL